MPRIMCQNCGRYTQQDGCMLQHQNYWQFRDCMLEVKDFSQPKEHDTDPEQLRQEGAADDRS